ncbi:MAG: glycosyl hydrolase [Phycisphaerae bacterium]|nr:glycosyl hydrolase [Phycisphaerae bacterium]
MNVDPNITPESLTESLERVVGLAAAKIRDLDAAWDPGKGAPVFTVGGKYTARGWTEWTQGFQFGMPLLVFDAADDKALLELGRQRTMERMAPHVTHRGVHDHGFNNVSTYGALRRLMKAGRIPHDDWELTTYEMALKCSAAVQAMRWSSTAYGHGYVCSFNGPHSLFSDTLRSMRVLSIGHELGHVLQSEHDERISLLDRLIQHTRTTARFNVYYGEGRDAYDRPGRVVHESIFNMNDGQYRCPSSQQGFSPFSTWTRGHAWIVCGAAEQLEWIAGRPEAEFEPFGGKADVLQVLERMARATADFCIDGLTSSDGITYWDDGAPGLASMPDWRDRRAEPFNDHEPVDASASAIAAQGLIILGRYLKDDHYTKAGLTVVRTLCNEPYLSTDASHQGLLLHSVYHRPNGWDHVPTGRSVPCGESSMWGDYHLLELAVQVLRMCRREAPYRFFG